MLDTMPLRDAYRTFLDAAATVAASDALTPPSGEWNADQIVAHVGLVTAGTLATVSAVAAGTNAIYDNRLSADLWTIERVIARCKDSAGLRERVRAQGDALCAFGGAALSTDELFTPVPTLLLSNDTVMVDQALPLEEIVAGLATGELPGHTTQILALLG